MPVNHEFLRQRTELILPAAESTAGSSLRIELLPQSRLCGICCSGGTLDTFKDLLGVLYLDFTQGFTCFGGSGLICLACQIGIKNLSCCELLFQRGDCYVLVGTMNQQLSGQRAVAGFGFLARATTTSLSGHLVKTNEKTLPCGKAMECSICTDLITDQTGQVKLACSHTFHLGCIARWMTRGASNCPMCRTDLGEKEVIEDDAVSSVSLSNAPQYNTVEFLAQYMGTTVGRAQIYLDTFNGDHSAVIEYVRYLRAYEDEPFYIPPLERPHAMPVLPDRYFGCNKEFGRKRYWMRYRKNVEYYHDRGYDTD